MQQRFSLSDMGYDLIWHLDSSMLCFLAAVRYGKDFRRVHPCHVHYVAVKHDGCIEMIIRHLACLGFGRRVASSVGSLLNPICCMCVQGGAAGLERQAKAVGEVISTPEAVGKIAKEPQSAKEVAKHPGAYDTVRLLLPHLARCRQRFRTSDACR